MKEGNEMEKETSVQNLQISEAAINTSTRREYKLKVDELGLSKIFIPSEKDSTKVRLNVRICGVFMLDKILRNKVCKTSGITVKNLKQSEGETPYSLALLQKEFERLTGIKGYWNNLQNILDYIATYNYGKNKGYQLDQFTETKVERCKQQVDFGLKEALKIAFLNYGTKTGHQITPREFCKRMNNLRKVIIEEYVPNTSSMESSVGKINMPITIENVRSVEPLDSMDLKTNVADFYLPTTPTKTKRQTVRVPEVMPVMEFPIIGEGRPWERSIFVDTKLPEETVLIEIKKTKRK